MSEAASLFRSIAGQHRRCFWLDGGGGRDWSGRRSIVGWLEDSDVSLTYDAATRQVTRHAAGRAEVVGDDMFDVLAAELAAGAPEDRWFGYLGYACRPDLPAATGSGLPDAVWMRPSRVRTFEHPAGGFETGASAPSSTTGVAVRATSSTSGSGGFETGASAPSSTTGVAVRASSSTSGSGGFETGASAPSSTTDAVVEEVALATVSKPPTGYTTAFDRVQEHLHAGNTYEVNLTYRLEAASDLDPVRAYLRLRELNPAPYAGFLQHDVPGARAWLLSSSPERYALVTGDRMLETKPIKGTTARGATAAEDERARERLRTDPRFRAENLMIVDLLRNDLSMVCEPGTVTVPALMDVESYESVHQLVSTVRGRLRDDVATVDALRALFPAGSMTGAPKLRTMQVIEEVEATPRGPYAGAVGWIGGDGRADLGVVIRSLTTAGDGRYALGTGGGITVRSAVEDEWAESRWKAARLLDALGTMDL